MVVLMADTVLGTELTVLMQQQRLGPAELSALAEVSRRTVYNILETGRANLDTLWKVSTGLATDPYTHVVNRLTQMDAFSRLLQAADYPPELAQLVKVDLSDELTLRLGGDREKAEALREFLDDYPTLPPSQRDMFDRAVRRKAQQTPTE